MAPQPLLDELLARLPDARDAGGPDGMGVLPHGVRERVERDPAALLLWQRLVQQVRLLSHLPRASAPPDLEGRVVASFHAGHRQDRVARELEGLTRAQVPASLDSRVRHLVERPFALPGLPAPSVLDRLVEVELEESRGLVARLIERLGAGEGAPSGRSSKWARRFGPPGSPGLERARRERRGMRTLLGAAGMALVALVAWNARPTVLASGPGATPGADAEALAAARAKRDTIQWERVHTDQDPKLASLLDSFVGGLSAGGGR